VAVLAIENESRLLLNALVCYAPCSYLADASYNSEPARLLLRWPGSAEVEGRSRFVLGLKID